MPNTQNYQSINSDIENINSESNIDIIYYNIRWNAFKNLIKNGSILGFLCCFAALTDAYIQNELTEDKFNNFSEFFQRTKKYLSWGLAAMGFSIFVDKSTFHYIDDIIKDIKELITGKKYFTNEEQTETLIKELQKQRAELEKDKAEIQIKLNEATQEIEKLKLKEEIKVFKENMLKEIDTLKTQILTLTHEKQKLKTTDKVVIDTKNFIKAHSNYNIEHINNFITSTEFDKQKIYEYNESSTSGYKQNLPKM
ncbi:hypothetical protein [Spiroplasma endosymbiont of Polydrusus pterygomalis]|uniref:hypothetical protein n=1 Tax=Spiroplasma endosymbiont of Polydrusus pterygomalis TaxID=3139327 RepID=UPI003CCA6E65